MKREDIEVGMIYKRENGLPKTVIAMDQDAGGGRNPGCCRVWSEDWGYQHHYYGDYEHDKEITIIYHPSENKLKKLTNSYRKNRR